MKKDIMAYYFPNWHQDSRNDGWHGKGWTEWEVTKCASPRFEGHRQPKIPLWGYEDESLVPNMEKKIEAAKSHAVDGFIFDWYWFSDGPYRQKCLDEAFLGSANSSDFKFAVMWANHDPIYVHPASYLGVKNKTLRLLDGMLTEEAFVKATDHVIKTYFTKQNYYMLDGGLYFGFFRPDMLINSFGGTEGCKAMLDGFRDRALKAGVGKLNINANEGNIPEWNSDRKKALATAKEAGFDSLGDYNIGSDDGVSDFPHSRYDLLCDRYYRIISSCVPKIKAEGLHSYITSSMGWDSSPRTVPSDRYENIGYPFSPICSDNTPDKFEAHLRTLSKFADENGIPLITVYAWNEWTEGGYLEPDIDYGFGYLDSVKKVFG